jgi:hypothetical protein
MPRKKNKLPADVAKEFRLVKWKGSSRQIFGHFGLVDLNTMSIQQSERLVQSGFSKLQRKQKKETKDEH